MTRPDGIDRNGNRSRKRLRNGTIKVQQKIVNPIGKSGKIRDRLCSRSHAIPFRRGKFFVLFEKNQNFLLPGRADGSELSGGVAPSEPGTQRRQRVWPFEVAHQFVDAVAALPNETHLSINEEMINQNNLFHYSFETFFFFISEWLCVEHQWRVQYYLNYFVWNGGTHSGILDMRWLDWNGISPANVPGESGWAGCKQSKPPAMTWRSCIQCGRQVEK